MEKADKKFDVSIFSETKGKDKFTIAFNFKIKSECNCRIKILECQVYDLDGNLYKADENNISTTDIIIGVSKYFSEEKKINVYISKLFKSRIGCSIVLTLADLDEKQKYRICYQKKSAIRWDVVGIEQLEYVDIISQKDEEIASFAVEEELDTEELCNIEENIIEENNVVESNVEENKVEETNAEEADRAYFEDDTVEDENIEDENIEDENIEDQAVEDEYIEDKAVEGNVARAEALEAESIENESENEVEDMDALQNMSQIERYLNSILEYDEAASYKIGLVLDNISLTAQEKNNNYYEVSLRCVPSPSTERRLLVRCPMIKAFFYDSRGSIDNVAMARMSMMSDIDEMMDITLKKAPLSYWEKLGKIRIMATV